MLTAVCLGGVSNFGTIIIKGMGFSTLVTTLMQIPYGFIISCMILSAVFLNDYMSQRGKQTRSWFIILYLCPNIAGAFGLRYLDEGNQAGRLISYYLTAGFNAVSNARVCHLLQKQQDGLIKVIAGSRLFSFSAWPRPILRAIPKRSLRMLSSSSATAR